MNIKRAVQKSATLATFCTVVLCPSVALSDAPLAMHPSVVGGEPVANGKYPFIVALQGSDWERVGNPYGHFCGGTLISDKKVLTAAHCVSKRKVNGTLELERSALTAAAGMTVYGSAQGQKRTVTHIAVHPDYARAGLASEAYDVAILTLDSAVTGLPLVSLATEGQDKEGQIGTVAGWGATFFGDPSTPLTMREGSVKITQSAKCVKDNKAYGEVVDPSLQICGESRPVDTCQGDSGGPLFVKDKKGDLIQLGIVSFGIGCGKIDGVYTRISNTDVTAFIEQNMLE